MELNVNIVPLRPIHPCAYFDEGSCNFAVGVLKYLK